MRFDEEIRFTRLTAGRKIHCESSSGSIFECVSSEVPRTSRGCEKVMIDMSPTATSSASRMVDRNLRTDSLPALFFSTISPSTVTSPQPRSRKSTSVAISRPRGLDISSARASPAGNRVAARMPSESSPAKKRPARAAGVVEFFICFILSRKIRSGGRKRKSTNSAKASVIAVSCAISRLTAKPD